LERLADIFVGANLDDQDRMTTAVERLNRRLVNHPLDEGESRSGNVRVTFIDLLFVRFRVDVSRQIVRVNGVKRFGR
jgi:hypothetical protein